MSTITEAPYLWWFYKGLDFAKRYHSAIVAQEIYCKTSPAEFCKKGRKEVFDKAFVSEHWAYRLPHNNDLKTERIYMIPDDLIFEIVERKGSVSDAFCYLLTQSDKCFSDFLNRVVDKIEGECGEKVEGFITLMDIPSLTTAAQSRGIPVIHFELGCWREPNYLHTAFWDLENLYGGKSVEHRWDKFQKEHKERPIAILTKQECLALLLQKDNLRLLEQYNRKPAKKIGAVLGYVTYELISSKTHLNDSELLYRAKKKYGIEGMAIRKHPGDPYGGQYPQYSEAMDIQKKSTPEFILDCETIISLVSGSCIEAMLWGRKAITLLPSPSYFTSGHEIEGEGLCAGDDFISFFAFCYLIPLEYLMDIDYIRWRLSEPTEREIYYKHLEFYLKAKGISCDLIFSNPDNRLDRMLEAQGYRPGEHL